ncbi:MAG TPA: hypothetical protein VHM48_11255, partial [Candidatus Limnocylindrales bacterium]|nr:hypothetical protein [Candidatus Limnocylindrales bacterium]
AAPVAASIGRPSRVAPFVSGRSASAFFDATPPAAWPAATVCGCISFSTAATTRGGATAAGQLASSVVVSGAVIAVGVAAGALAARLLGRDGR